MGTAPLDRLRSSLEAPDERDVLEKMGTFLRDGLELKKWFEETESENGLNPFDLVETLNRPDRSQGFFATAEISGRQIPVMGVIDDVFYDQAKSAGKERAKAAAWMRDQIREFVLGYFLRISDCRRPQMASDDEQNFWRSLLGPFSLRPVPEVEREGMGFSQVFFQKRENGEVGEFPEEERCEVVDLREIGRSLNWVILRLQVYQFNVSLRIAGAGTPQFTVPLKEESYLVVTPDFVRNVDNPEPGVLGEYGFGYAFIKNPKRGPFAYGPGEFEIAFQTINFRVLKDGSVRVRMSFASDQPQKVLNLMLDPVEWTFTLADFMSFGQASRLLAPFKNMLQQMPFRDFNLDPTVSTLDFMNTVTSGQAGEQLAISKEELYRGFLRRHSIQHYQTILGSLRTFRQIPNWSDRKRIPEWVRKGWSS